MCNTRTSFCSWDNFRCEKMNHNWHIIQNTGTNTKNAHAQHYVIIGNYHLAGKNNMVSELSFANEVRFFFFKFVEFAKKMLVKTGEQLCLNAKQSHRNFLLFFSCFICTVWRDTWSLFIFIT